MSLQDKILYGLGGTIAVSIPTTIVSIEDPFKRAIISLSALLAVFGLGLFTTVPKRR